MHPSCFFSFFLFFLTRSIIAGADDIVNVPPLRSETISCHSINGPFCGFATNDQHSHPKWIKKLLGSSGLLGTSSSHASSPHHLERSGKNKDLLQLILQKLTENVVSKMEKMNSQLGTVVEEGTEITIKDMVTLEDLMKLQQGAGGDIMKNVHKLLEEQEPTITSAAFAVHGHVNRNGAWWELRLHPKDWTRSPPTGWVTIGLVGKINHADGYLEATIVDSAGNEIEDCSRLIAAHAPGYLSGKIHGVWEGSYACRGSANNVILTLTMADDNTLTGEFSFVATTYKGRRTKAGCVCKQNWRYEGKNYIGGICAESNDRIPNPWCYYEPGTCTLPDPKTTELDECAPEINVDSKDGSMIVLLVDEQGNPVQSNLIVSHASDDDDKKEEKRKTLG